MGVKDLEPRAYAGFGTWRPTELELAHYADQRNLHSYFFLEFIFQLTCLGNKFLLGLVSIKLIVTKGSTTTVAMPYSLLNAIVNMKNKSKVQTKVTHGITPYM